MCKGSLKIPPELLPRILQWFFSRMHLKIFLRVLPKILSEISPWSILNILSRSNPYHFSVHPTDIYLAIPSPKCLCLCSYRDASRKFDKNFAKNACYSKIPSRVNMRISSNCLSTFTQVMSQNESLVIKKRLPRISSKFAKNFPRGFL